MHKALVKNAGDLDQVKKGQKKERFNRMDEEDDIKAVMSSKNGRRFVWRLLSNCGAFRSIWEGSAKIHYNSGRADVAHELMAKIIEADKNLYLEMQRESMDVEF